ncbi:MAG: cytidylate kinase family protein [Candidatus Pacebacteria bacterium]|nr:cytidylate kinase family protein [Candidatus Paceibacterota bacterium]MDR3583670.1 cytidylate kinase family protein [Candidatus Paceibacterota bacterium]
MIITLNGSEGSGKTTVAKKIASELDYVRYTTGEIFRAMAKKRGLTLVEYVQLGETDPEIDKEVDDYVVKLSKEQDNFILDSRMAWHFIPQSTKIYLNVDEREGAKRVFAELQKDNSRNEMKNTPKTVEEVLKKIQARQKTDDTRYLQYYNVNIRDKKNYDFVLDTTELFPEEVFEKVMAFINSKINAQPS